MNFTDSVFLPFLVIVLLLQSALGSRRHLQVLMLTGASYVFYGWWDVRFLSLIVLSSAVDYFIAAGLVRTSNIRIRRSLLATSLAVNLGVLGFFKYANFFLECTRDGLSFLAIDAQHVPTLDVILPVGISFYTFQTLSYTIDVYRGKLDPVRHPSSFFFFVAAFPQLVAGPIVRASDFLPQVQKDFLKRRDLSGVFLILYGLFKKVLLADVLGTTLVDGPFANPAQHNALELTLAAYAYSFQIFLDFSAYSDIAIGIGWLLGIRFPRNFNAPYLATSLVGFWRRWHISLTSWFRDYVYLPLGGNRGSTARWTMNVLVVFLLSGLWHGAAIKFVIWGAIHAVIYLGEHLLVAQWNRRKLPMPTGWAWTGFRLLVVFHVVTLAWVFFRADSFSTATTFLATLLSGLDSPGSLNVPGFAVAALAAAVFLHVAAEPRTHDLAIAFTRLPIWSQALAATATGVMAYWVADLDMARKAFIYFQF